MCKQYFFTVLLTCTVLHTFSVVSEDTKPYGVKEHPSAKVNVSNNNPKESKSNLTDNSWRDHIAEGGKINLAIPRGREHVEGLTSSSTTTQTSIEKTILANMTAPSLNHKPSLTDNGTGVSNSVMSEAPTNNTSVKPVTESTEVVGDSKVKPRKGVDFNNSTLNPQSPLLANSSTIKVAVVTKLSTSTTMKAPTTTKFVPHKPKVTVGSDEEDPPPRLFINGKEIHPKNTSTSYKKNVMDDEVIITNRRVDRGSYYVLPIVLTILAVPLLAIILTVVYKRGSEWWQHRHYRRMDFLIDGMYNN